MGKKNSVRNSKQMRESHLKCPNCNHISSIPRHTNRTRRNNHIKNFYCPKCKSYQKHNEINDYDKYKYLKDNDLLSEVKIYHAKRREELVVETSKVIFKYWDQLENDLVTKNYVMNADYNLIENLLLNYINKDSLFFNINNYYMKNGSKRETLDKVRIKFNISSFILNRFKIICRQKNKDCINVIQTILEYLLYMDNSIDFNSER